MSPIDWLRRPRKPQWASRATCPTRVRHPGGRHGPKKGADDYFPVEAIVRGSRSTWAAGPRFSSRVH
eukprot:8548162-Pyramimonas_sp.AAC.1